MRILDIDSGGPIVSVACDPHDTPQEVLDWLLMQDKITSAREISEPGWWRAIPIEVDTHRWSVWPARGPGRGAFYMREYVVSHDIRG